MEQPDICELQRIFRLRVRDSFTRARACLRRARQARQEGDMGRLRKLVVCTRILRAAAAGWRERAQGIAP